MVSVQSSPILIIPEERKQRELKQALEREATEHQRVRTLLIPLGIFTFWQLLGALFMLMSAHANDEKIGQAYFAAAFAVGYGGAFFNLIIYYVRGRERDDW